MGFSIQILITDNPLIFPRPEKNMKFHLIIPEQAITQMPLGKLPRFVCLQLIPDLYVKVLAGLNIY